MWGRRATPASSGRAAYVLSRRGSALTERRFRLAGLLHQSVSGEELLIPEVSDDLRFLGLDHTAVAGTGCQGLVVRTATRVVGKLQGFIVDRVTDRLQYLVVKTSGLLGRTTLVPVTAARIDLEGRAIELLDQDETQLGEPFDPEQFRLYSEDELTLPPTP